MSDPIVAARAALQERLEQLDDEAEKVRTAIASIDELLGAEPEPEPETPKRRTRRAPEPAESASPQRDTVLAALRELSAQSDDGWVRPLDIQEATGVTSNAARGALYRLRDLGIAESNGERTIASRWRPVEAKPARKPARRREPEPIEDDDDIENDGPFAGEDDEDDS